MSVQSSSRNSLEMESQLKQRATSNLNLRHNDNAFHVLASLLVDFFQARLVIDKEDENTTRLVNISSEDRTALQRLLPKTAMWDFIDAVNYRLEITPVVPTTPIHLLTLRCQEFCLDKDEEMENPILAAYEITTRDTVTVNVLSVVLNNNKVIASTVLDDDSGSDDAVDYRGTLHQSSDNSDDSDGFVHTNVESISSELSSSDGSGIKVASSKDIADEMEQHKKVSAAVEHHVATTTVLSDNDSMPTEYDDDDFEEVLNEDKIEHDDVPSLNNDIIQCAGVETRNNGFDQNLENKPLMDVTNASITSMSVIENLNNDADEKLENDNDHRESIHMDIDDPVVEEGEEIEVLPTITGTFDDETKDMTQELQQIDDGHKTFLTEPSFVNKKFFPPVDESNDVDIGEEIEVLPTITIDDATLPTVAGADTTEIIQLDNNVFNTAGTSQRKESTLLDELPEYDTKIITDKIPIVKDVDIGEEIEVLPTETIDDATAPTVAGVDNTEIFQADNFLDNTGTRKSIERHKVDESSEYRTKEIPPTSYDNGVNSKKYDNCSFSKDRTTSEPLQSSANIHSNKNENAKELDAKESVTTTLRPINKSTDFHNIDNQTFDDTTATGENATLRMQAVAGAFFSDLRHAIDEKVEAFEYALVNAIISKPIQRDLQEKYHASESSKKSATHGTAESSGSKCEASVNKTTAATDHCLSDTSIGKKKYAHNELKAQNVNQDDEGVQIQVNEQSMSIKSRKEQVSPTSLSVQSGFTSLFAGFAAGFVQSERETDLKTVQTKSIISSFPSDESQNKFSDCSVAEYSTYESMEVTDVATKQQLILELKEAGTLMKQSITPETKRFWSDHIQSLKSRLDSLRMQPKENFVLPSSQQHKTNDDHESSNKHHESLPAVESDMQSTAMMSEIKSTKGIPVVPAMSQHSIDFVEQYRNEYQVQSIPRTSVPRNAPKTSGDYVEKDMNLPLYGHPEIELSESRGRFAQSPSDEMYTNPHDSNMQHSGDNDDDGYYEYPLVDVVAPADLPGGYHFEAEIEGQRFLATVPPGGVQQGETFTCFMKELDSVAIDIPVGDWKDGLFNMCELGWCHPVLWNALFCPLIALGQIQTRVNLDFLGRPKFGELPYTNRFMMLMVVASWLGMNTALFAASNFKWSRGLELSVADSCAFILVNVAMFGFVVFVTQSTRSSVREKFMIRERCCYDLEDVCCAALCLPCTIGQMQRHTANYNDYEAVCCSKTGLPNGVRVNQEPAKVKEPTIENVDGFMV